MEYEDRDDDSIQIWEIEPDECPYCETPMGLGHTKGCWVDPANRSRYEIYGTLEHESWLIEMERQNGR